MTDYRTWGDKLGENLFRWAASVAERRGAEIRFQRLREVEALGGMVPVMNLIVVNFGEQMADEGQGFHDEFGAEAGADPALSEWMVAVCILLHELGHWELHRGLNCRLYQADPAYNAAIEAEAGNFSARFLNALVARGMAMTEDEGAALSEQIRDEILAKRAI